MPTRQQVEAHRRDLNALVRLAQNDLRLILEPINEAELARDALLDTLPQLVAIYGAAAATLAGDWYDDLRDASAARGRFTAITAELPDAGRTDILARWAVDPLFAATPDKVKALNLASGGLQRIVADADRETITVSSIEDRAARGWTRETSGGCDFCQMLAGNLYTEAGADFQAHDHCGCFAAPAFG